LIKTTIIPYAGCNIEVPELLALNDYWPYGLPLEDWPTFCGAGEGIGDRIIPDTICGVRVACCCFEHDISWCIADGSFVDFMKSNLRLYCNLRAIVLPRIPYWQKLAAEAKCFFYFAAVCTVGHKIFKKQFSTTKQYLDPFDNPGVKEKLHRLAMATLNYPTQDYAN